MRQRQCLSKILIEPQHPGYGPRDLRYLNGVGQPVPEMIGIAGREDLSLVFQPTKCPRVDDAIAIPLKFVAIGMGKFRITAPACAFHRKAKMGERAGAHLLGVRQVHLAQRLDCGAADRCAAGAQRLQHLARFVRFGLGDQQSQLDGGVFF